MCILLTGGTGVFGSYLLTELLNKGYEVVCLKRTTSSMSNVSHIIGNVTWYDLDQINLRDIFLERDIDVVIHTATNYGKNPTAFYDAYDANLVLPISLLRLACEKKSRAFLSTGTFFDKELNDEPFSKQSVYMDTYVKSKHLFEYISATGISNTETTFINMRLEHVYGLDSHRKFVNYILESLKSNVDHLELSEGTQNRDWIYIDDVIQAYLCVIDNLETFEKSRSYTIDVGTGETHSVREFVELCKKITGADTRLMFGTHPMHETEIQFSKADISILEKLGWKAEFTIEKGINEILKKMR